MYRPVMKKLLPLAAFILVLVALPSRSLTAQDQATKIVFIDVPRILSAYPGGEAVAEMRQQAQEEITGLQAELQAVVGNARSLQELSPEQREAADTIRQTIEQANLRWQQEIEQAAQPVLDAVNQAVAEVAQANGYAIVFDGVVARNSGLVIYAADDLNVTEQVLERTR
jgi:outer membrane protein